MKETLYKQDSKGKLRFFTIFTEGPEIIQHSGLVGTDSPVEHRKTAKAKNVGKSNETTPEEQAVSQAQSTLKKKKDRGYFESLEEAKNTKVLLPMLAKDYNKHFKKIDWEGFVVAQPKLDGMRCSAIIKNNSVKFVSRKNIEITTMDHIKEELKNLPDCVLDGELYAHGYSFQQNMSLINKFRPGESEVVKLCLYDLVSEKPFKQRYEELALKLPTIGEYTQRVENRPIGSKAELDKVHTEFISQGYEGTIVRHGDAPYKIDGRSENLLKYKDFIDIALPIKDIVPGDQRPEEGFATFYWEGATDDTLTSGMKFSHDERKEFLKNKEKYIGKTAEIRFFEYSDTGVPRFPVMVGFREDK